MVVLQEAPSRRHSESFIFDIPVDLAHPGELLNRITGWVARGDRGRRVMYVNAHVLNQSLEQPRLRDALHAADLVYCDGYGVRLAAKALEVQIPHRMTGADWIWDLAALCEAAGLSVYLLGWDPGYPPGPAARLHSRHPRLAIAGTHHGYFEVGSPHDERVVEEINACRPAILLARMGTPKEERWVQRNAARLDAGVLGTVGALFDYVSGRTPRAPGWLADNGLEWIFRLAIEPQRMWRRYLLGNPVFVSRVIARSRGRRPRPA